ncbi:MAG: PAS domain S-box protein [Candidatus Aminicenantales bacterium]
MKSLEKGGKRESKEREGFIDLIFETLREPLVILDGKLRVVSANRTFYTTFRVKPEETQGKYIHELGSGRWNIPQLRLRLEKIMHGDSSFDNFELNHDFPRIGERTILINARRIKGDSGKEEMILLAMEDITEGKKTEASLIESEEKYKDLVEKAGVAILIDDRKGNIVYGNERFAELFGYTVEEIRHQSIRTLVHPDDVERVMRFHKERMKGKIHESKYEFRGVRKDGSIIYLEVDAGALKEGEKIVGTRSYIWDITERKKAEEALKESEEKYRAIVEQSHDAIYIYRGNRFLFVNDTVARITGYTKDELYQMNVWNLIHPDDRERVKKIGRDRAEGKEVPSRYVARVVTRKGESRYCEFAVKAISYRGEYAAIGAVRDVTEQKKAEEALRESEEKYKLIAETSPDAVTTTDLEGRITYASPLTVKMHGYRSSRELMGRSSFELIHPRDHEKAQTNLEKVLRGKAVRNSEYTFLRKDGKAFAGELSVSLITNGSGKPVGFIAITRDITERKRAEREIQLSNKKLLRALEGTVHALASAVEKRDPSTAGHQERVARLAGVIAREMGLPEERIRGIRMAGLVHDVGKIYIPAEILSKASLLNEVEIALIRTHPKVGYDILRGIEFPWPVAKIVLQHHERLNGSGYPTGLTGEDILLEARILAVADVVEAMYSHRPYRPALGLEAAFREITRHRSTLYDSAVVDACLKLFKEKGFRLEGVK